MKVIVRVLADLSDRPPDGAPIIVEARDTTFEDAPAPAIASAMGQVRPGSDPLLDIVEMEISALPVSSIVWVHVDVNRDGRVSIGDFVTMESYPIRSEPVLELEVRVRRV